jgi:rRNA maturation endonuclease Nob1
MAEPDPRGPLVPRFPDGVPVLVCRPCRAVALHTARCPACGGPTIRATIYNEPSVDVA